MCSNVFKFVQTCSKPVQMCSSVFNYVKLVQTCSKLVQMGSNCLSIPTYHIKKKKCTQRMSLRGDVPILL